MIAVLAIVLGHLFVLPHAKTGIECIVAPEIGVRMLEGKRQSLRAPDLAFDRQIFFRHGMPGVATDGPGATNVFFVEFAHDNVVNLINGARHFVFA